MGIENKKLYEAKIDSFIIQNGVRCYPLADTEGGSIRYRSNPGLPAIATPRHYLTFRGVFMDTLALFPQYYNDELKARLVIIGAKSPVFDDPTFARALTLRFPENLSIPPAADTIEKILEERQRAASLGRALGVLKMITTAGSTRGTLYVVESISPRSILKTFKNAVSQRLSTLALGN